eukprot:9278868-Alexandrium_andersonii.AAC.1
MAPSAKRSSTSSSVIGTLRKVLCNGTPRRLLLVTGVCVTSCETRRSPPVATPTGARGWTRVRTTPPIIRST